MAIPFIIGGIAVAAGLVGAKKGFDAKEDFDRAERIGKRAQRNHEEAKSKLDTARKNTNTVLEDLGKTKVAVFNEQFKFLVDFSKKLKGSSSAKLKGFDEFITPIQLKEMEKMVSIPLELDKNLGSSAVGGALAGLAAYGTAGAVGAASTGTAITALSGAAAKSATLAYLGGGSLAAGGLGMAGGMAVLGGAVLGPALAIGGFLMASKAEEAVTEAYNYEAKVDKAVAEIDRSVTYLAGIRANAKEMENIITSMVKRFEENKVTSIHASDSQIEKMFAVGKALKQLIDTPILTADDKPVSDLVTRIQKAVSSTGFLTYKGA
ncbi:hypothetical protein [Actinobacillus genomosp. 1]|uniref:hypothetical protein n=1 Tax=Actinobacillus genomosp. 1 TaxID=254839 RepID=UPI002441E0BB|nr:hypothetical protein [Actinobacillus genomosp. 1]WGE91860.1 hypothetical protein NYR63_02605 [Actinobacillus genomosp. 1]